MAKPKVTYENKPVIVSEFDTIPIDELRGSSRAKLNGYINRKIELSIGNDMTKCRNRMSLIKTLNDNYANHCFVLKKNEEDGKFLRVCIDCGCMLIGGLLHTAKDVDLKIIK